MQRALRRFDTSTSPEVMGLGDPLEYYDAIVTAGFSIKKGQAGTLGELEPKPHPWLYAETLFALHIPATEAVAIEDSGASILAISECGNSCNRCGWWKY